MLEKLIQMQMHYLKRGSYCYKNIYPVLEIFYIYTYNKGRIVIKILSNAFILHYNTKFIPTIENGSKDYS